MEEAGGRRGEGKMKVKQALRFNNLKKERKSRKLRDKYSLKRD